jgi:hypothetical protein
MEWRRSSTPARINECGCGSTSVEVRADGIVRHYRCAACLSPLGDLTMGPEP